MLYCFVKPAVSGIAVACMLLTFGAMSEPSDLEVTGSSAAHSVVGSTAGSDAWELWEAWDAWEPVRSMDA